MTKRAWGVRVLVLGLVAACGASLAAQDDAGWVDLFDGKSLKGWKASEAKESFRVKDGAIVSNGKPRSHLFYVGDEKPFVNFVIELEIMTKPGANAGVYFHTKYQETGWPKHGYEAQVNNTHKDPKKTASVYGVVNVLKAPAKDNEWFTMKICVKGRHIVTEVNGKKQVDYTEPEDKEPGKNFTRKLDKGTFALQAHDPDSVVLFRKIRVKRLP